MDLETVAGIEKHLSSLDSEFLERDTKIAAEIAQAEKRGFAPQVEQLQRQRETHAGTHERITALIKAKIPAAQERETQAAAAEAQRVEERENAVKSKALSSWINAGGKAADFETSWPVIRAQMLQAEVLKKMAVTEARPNPFLKL